MADSGSSSLRPVSPEMERAIEAVDLTVEPATFVVVLEGENAGD